MMRDWCVNLFAHLCNKLNYLRNYFLMICIWLKVLMIVSFSFFKSFHCVYWGLSVFVYVNTSIVFHKRFTFSALPLCLWPLWSLFRSRLNSDVFIQSLNSIFSANFDPAVPSSSLVDLWYLDFIKLYFGT